MKSGKGHQEEEEEEEEEVGTKKDAAASSNNTKGKNCDKVNVIRSKHSVTEQRRRSKINERFQILRELIPHSEQKRDTASFLLEVIQYVEFLQEKVQKYEGSYQAWNSETTKLMPWRNSHWRMPSFASNPQGIKNGTASGPTFPGRFDENNITVPSSMHPNQQNPIDSDMGQDASSKAMDQQTELANHSVTMAMPVQANAPVTVQTDGTFSHVQPRPASDAQSSECQSASDALNHQDDFTIEGGTISISSMYSQGLLNTLTHALQSTGLDLSQASISVQIDLGKRPNRGDHEDPMPSGNQSVGHFRETSNGEDLNQAKKRTKL